MVGQVYNRRIFDNDEPSVRLVSMLRWRRGAFQNIETALAILHSKKLVHPVTQPLPGVKKRYDFELYADAFTFLDEAVKLEPTFCWYRDRTALEMRIAGQNSGTILKAQQYEHDEYRQAPFATIIPSIKDKVAARLSRPLK